MLYLLSPAKSLDYERRVPAVLARKASEPQFTAQAQTLISLLKDLPADKVAALMDLSPALAELNVARYATWQPDATPANSRPAVLAFNGDVYEGLDAHSLKAADLDWAQRHMVILSGLYGVLRPLDRLQPYRLEMGTALAGKHGKDLYAFWGEQIAGWLNEQQAAESKPVIVNLASVEYARAALRKGLRASVIDCVFEDWHGGEYKIISFFAKRARGLMARHAIERRIRTPKQLSSFDAEGYAFDPDVSTPQRLVFRRRAAPQP